jgi:hypothetical protein
MRKILFSSIVLFHSLLFADSIDDYNQGMVAYESKNYLEAAYWYKKAAKQGEAFAQANLAIMYYLGQGIKQDYNEALYWFENSASQGNPTAQLNLGYMYKQGIGTLQDYNKAYYWFEQAAIWGDAYAQLNLGEMHYFGLGVEKDYANALIIKKRRNIIWDICMKMPKAWNKIMIKHFIGTKKRLCKIMPMLNTLWGCYMKMV